MLLDLQAIFSDQQSLVQDGSTPVVSSNVLDFGETAEVAYSADGEPKQKIKRRIGVGMEIPFLCQITEQVAGDVSEVEFIMQQSDAEGFGSGVEEVIKLTVEVAKLIPGFQLPIDKFPREISKRYLRMVYKADDEVTSGKIVCGVAQAVDSGYRG
jgi:hypothetical protein